MNRHPCAGQTVPLKLLAPHPEVRDGEPFVIEDWGLLVSPTLPRTPAGMEFAARLGDRADFEAAVYGKVGSFGLVVVHEELVLHERDGGPLAAGGA